MTFKSIIICLVFILGTAIHKKVHSSKCPISLIIALENGNTLGGISQLVKKEIQKGNIRQENPEREPLVFKFIVYKVKNHLEFIGAQLSIEGFAHKRESGIQKMSHKKINEIITRLNPNAVFVTSSHLGIQIRSSANRLSIEVRHSFFEGIEPQYGVDGPLIVALLRKEIINGFEEWNIPQSYIEFKESTVF